MLKINLSGRKAKNKENTVDESVEKTHEDTAAQSILTDSGTKVGKKKSPQTLSRRGIILVLILAVVTAGYFQKDKIAGLFGEKQEDVKTVKPPPPEPEVKPKESDPVFVALNRISDVVPERVWLSSVVVMYDGKYEIKGLAFSHEPINPLIASLKNTGSVSSENIPKKSKLSETVYNFSVNGSLSNVNVPEILDIIPTEQLASLADGIKGKSKEYNINFTSLPKSGQTYKDTDLPFVLVGSYNGLKKVVGELCPEGGDTKVYRLVISPASPGMTFDKVKASFSLRAVSSI